MTREAARASPFLGTLMSLEARGRQSYSEAKAESASGGPCTRSTSPGRIAVVRSRFTDRAPLRDRASRLMPYRVRRRRSVAERPDRGEPGRATSSRTSISSDSSRSSPSSSRSLFPLPGRSGLNRYISKLCLRLSSAFFSSSPGLTSSSSLRPADEKTEASDSGSASITRMSPSLRAYPGFGATTWTSPRTMPTIWASASSSMASTSLSRLPAEELPSGMRTSLR